MMKEQTDMFLLVSIFLKSMLAVVFYTIIDQ